MTYANRLLSPYHFFLSKGGCPGRFLNHIAKILFEAIILKVSGAISLSCIYVGLRVLLLRHVYIYKLFLCRRWGDCVAPIDTLPDIKFNHFCRG